MPKATFDKRRRRWQVIAPPVGNQARKRRYFKTQEDADTYAASLKGLRDSSFADFVALPPAVRSRIMRCLEQLGGVDALEKSAAAFVAALPRTEKTLADACKECVDAKRKAGRSWQYTDNLETALGHFQKDSRGLRPLHSITAKEVAEWLDKPRWSPETRKTYLRRLDTLFRFAQKQGYSASNPCSAVETPSSAETPICVLSARDCRRILETCRRIDPALLPYFAIGLFAGIRPDELKRLRDSNLKGDWIEVEGAKSKTRRRRLVEVHPTLKAWLEVPGGKIGWKNWRRRWRQVREATAVGGFGPELPVQWGPDILRHSFCSYAYPVKGAHWTSMHAGHSERTLFARYRELVREEDAREFWGIVPA